MAAFAYDQSMALIGSTLGDARQVDSITITPLTLNSWLLTGFLRPLRDSEIDSENEFEKESEGDSEGDSEGITQMLRSKAVDTEVIPSMDDEGSSGGDGYSSDTDADSSEESERLGRRGRGGWSRWSESEVERLRECMREECPWKKIFPEFLEGPPALCVRTGICCKRKRKEKSSVASSLYGRAELTQYVLHDGS